MMPRAKWKKVAKYVGAFLIVFLIPMFLTTLLPDSIRSLLRFVIGGLFIFSAIYLLDSMLPGFNLLSFAPCRLPGSTNRVLLTFDDGPVEPYTRQILEILDRYKAKGTFFCIGENVEKAPDLVREIVKRGHEVANHTQNHRALPFLSKSEIEKQIQEGANSIHQVTGVYPKYFRCPKGYKSRRVLRIAHQLGQKAIGFSYPIFDVENPPAKELVERVLRKVRGGDILLMHDGFVEAKPGSRSSLVEALPQILEGMRLRGLECGPIREAL